jgi:hypothetical protein
MTLGCGGFGGNITSDNISPRHLLNIKRVAYELTPTISRWDRVGSAYRSTESTPSPGLPSAPARPPAPAGISADALSRRIDEFLGSRGFKAGTDRGRTGDGPGSDPSAGVRRVSDPSQTPLDFVCEEDVRLALQAGRKLIVSERAIVTPAARDLGEQHRVFAVEPWRG